MRLTHPESKRALGVVPIVVLTVAALLAGLVAAVSAQPVDASVPTSETLYDPRPQNSWGVSGLDPGSGNFQFYSPVFALEEVGNTMFVGGKFLQATNGVLSGDQPYLAAFTVASGTWQPAFGPELTWSVFALASDAARNRLFVGGEFPSVNGNSSAAGFAAIDPVNGNLDSAFSVRLGAFGGAQPRVHALEVSGGYLYIAGFFNSITGSNGQQVAVNKVARVSLATGNVDASWAPNVADGTVWSLAVDSVGGRVLLGGTFTTVNGTATPLFAMVSSASGVLSSYDRNFGTYYFAEAGLSYVAAIRVAGDRILVGGQRHRVVLTDRDLRVLTVHITDRYQAANGGTGGDIQTIEVSGNVAFIGCHCWGQVNRELPDKTKTLEYTDVRSTFALDLTTGRLINWFQPDFSGTAGAWAMEVDQAGCLWVGTDATQAGQVPARGVVKLCQGDNLTNRPGVTARLSSNGPFSSGAQRAIDGDYRTNLVVGSQGFAVSSAETTPYLEIDLGRLRSVDDVILWARTDAERLDLRDVHVWSSATPITSDDWSVLRADPGVFETSRLGSHAGKRTLSFGVDRPVRYLRIEVDFGGAGAPDVFQMAEVAVTNATTVGRCGDPSAPYDGIGGHPGMVYRLYCAVFAREADAGGFAFWVDSPKTIRAIAADFIHAPEFAATYGSVTNARFVELLYQNVLGRNPDAPGSAFWLGRMASGMTRSEVVLGFSESPEFRQVTYTG